MNSTQAIFDHGSPPDRSEPARKLDSIVWAIFFIWVGIVMLTDVPWGWFLFGVGFLIVATQLARWQMRMKVEAFWVSCGLVLLAGGLWSLLSLPWPLAPVLLILLGLWLLAKAVVGSTR